jgi:hypothetical protein
VVLEEFILAMCKDSARDKLLPNRISLIVGRWAMTDDR